MSQLEADQDLWTIDDQIVMKYMLIADHMPQTA